jgi:hypothetical protein
MDHPDSDRVMAHELQTTLKELREKNKKLTDEKDAAVAASSWGWVIAVVLLLMLGMATCGTHDHLRQGW